MGINKRQIVFRIRPEKRSCRACPAEGPLIHHTAAFRHIRYGLHTQPVAAAYHEAPAIPVGPPEILQRFPVQLIPAHQFDGAFPQNSFPFPQPSLCQHSCKMGHILYCGKKASPSALKLIRGMELKFFRQIGDSFFSRIAVHHRQLFLRYFFYEKGCMPHFQWFKKFFFQEFAEWHAAYHFDNSSQHIQSQPVIPVGPRFKQQRYLCQPAGEFTGGGPALPVHFLQDPFRLLLGRIMYAVIGKSGGHGEQMPDCHGACFLKADHVISGIPAPG